MRPDHLMRTMHAHSRIGRARRLLLAAILASLTMAPQTAVADHGGRDITAQFNCNRPVTPPRCTSVGDNPWHLVYFDPSLTEELAASMRRTLADDYGPTKLVVIEQGRLTRTTDVIAFSGDYGENGAAGWVYCPSDAPQGTNPSGDRWCRHQELHLNINPRYGAFFDDDASRDYVTCHEMGHTIGLRHWGNPPETSGTDVGATCMNADTPNGPTGLHQYDIDHITASHSRRDPWPGRRLIAAPREPRPRQQLLPWAGRLDALEVDSANSLAELVTTSDAVVRARVVAVSPGRTFDGLHYATASLAVEEVLAGHAGSSLALEIPLFDGPESIDHLPAWGESVFFLRNKGESARMAGLSAQRQRDEIRFYRLMSFDALVVNADGRALADVESSALADLSGLDFEAAVDRIETAVD
jgi:hypothetical protein